MSDPMIVWSLSEGEGNTCIRLFQSEADAIAVGKLLYPSGRQLPGQVRPAPFTVRRRVVEPIGWRPDMTQAPS